MPTYTDNTTSRAATRGRTALKISSLGRAYTRHHMPPSMRAACSKSATACSVSGSWKSCLAQSGDSVNVSHPCPRQNATL